MAGASLTDSTRALCIEGGGDTNGYTDGDTNDDILKAVERARAFGLCLRRIWAVAANLPGEAKSLSRLIPAAGTYSVPSHSRQQHEHEQCTFDFCEHSRIDSTSVTQRHEDCECNCGKYNFPVRLLDERIERSKFTAWRLVSGSSDDTPPLLDSKYPYMALSHVWADGTGGGISGPGAVNKCLYNFFCDIARHFQCEGLWWDAISIPTDEEMRRKALNVMHNNYAVARITLVHDLYLREWEWVNAEMACFAIVMSPWFSRGWTALELAMSHKVKILFKSRKNEGHIIKDLDIDILDKVPRSSPYHNLAMAIVKLRTARIQSLGDLLATLGPRDTSKPRDVPIISGLLAGIPISGGLSHQEIYQRILRKLGKVAQGHLFHNLSTMTAPGFSWCPTNILDMPMADTDSESTLLNLRENGDLEGTWKVYPIKDIGIDDLLFQNIHPLTVISLKTAFNTNNKEKHILLVENFEDESPAYKALLVCPMQCNEQTASAIYCRFVGPVYFRAALGDIAKGDKSRPMTVILTNTDGMRVPGQSAWSYVCDVVDAFEVNSELEITNGNLAEEEDAVCQDREALLFLANDKDDLREQLFSDEYKVKPSMPAGLVLRDKSAISHDITMSYVFREGSGIEGMGAFFYGSQRLLNLVKDWRQVQSGELMVVFLDENSNLQIDSSQSSERKAHLGGKALQIAVAMSEHTAPLVTLLLDNGAQHIEDERKQLPIHLAAEKSNYIAVETLVTNKTSPADPRKTNDDMRTAIHVLIRASRGRFFTAEEELLAMSAFKILLKKMDKASLNAQDSLGQTALIEAVRAGRTDMTRCLLGAGVSVNIQDKERNTALHHAVKLPAHFPGQCLLKVLLEHPVANCRGKMTEEKPTAYVEKPVEKLGNQSHLGYGDGQTDESCTRQMHSKLPQEKHLCVNIQNTEGETPLHLVASSCDRHESDNSIEVLLAHGADPLLPDSRSQPALTRAAYYGQSGRVESLLSQKIFKLDKDELDAALLVAVSLGGVSDKTAYRKTTEVLINNGAQPGHQDSNGMTALHWAIRNKDEDAARMILNIKGEVPKKTLDKKEEGSEKTLDKKYKRSEQSALLMATEAGLSPIVSLLLKNEADITSKDRKKRTALHWAADREYKDIVEMLLEKSSSLVHERDVQGRTALHLAARRGAASIIDALVSAKADPQIQDKTPNQSSALMLAAEYGRFDSVKKLLDLGCDRTPVDGSGKSALDRAAMNGFNRVVTALIRYPEGYKNESSDVRANAKANSKALRLAAIEGHFQVMMTLYDAIDDPELQASALPIILFAAAKSAKTPEFISRDSWI